MKVGYNNPFGLWQVTTEGDAEGRSTKYLGEFEGFVDEIALHLAEKCCYSLRFRRLEQRTKSLPKTRNSIDVMFDIESGTWGTSKERVEKVSKIFEGRPVLISNSNYFASFKISVIESEEEKKKKREKALSKLTEEDKKLLGL